MNCFGSSLVVQVEGLLANMVLNCLSSSFAVQVYGLLAGAVFAEVYRFCSWDATNCFGSSLVVQVSLTC